MERFASIPSSPRLLGFSHGLILRLVMVSKLVSSMKWMVCREDRHLAAKSRCSWAVFTSWETGLMFFGLMRWIPGGIALLCLLDW